MAQLTSIEWTDASWNPLVAYHSDTGKRGWFCTHVSEGCRNCYAEKINQRLGNGLAYIAQNSTRIKWGTVNLDQPSRWRTPKRIFVNSMTDPFHEDVPESMIDQVFAAMALTYKMQWTEDRGNIREPRHVFQLLTKRHERMKRYIQRLLANDWIKDWFTIRRSLLCTSPLSLLCALAPLCPA
jgi:protein gp37